MSVADQGTLPSTPSCKRRASIESQASDSITRGTKKPRLSCHSSVGDPDTRVEANTEEQEGYWTKPIHQVLGIEEYYNRKDSTLTEEVLKGYNAQQAQHGDLEEFNHDEISEKELQEPNEELLRVAEEGGFDLGYIRGIEERCGTESRSKTVDSDMRHSTYAGDFRQQMEKAGIHPWQPGPRYPSPVNLDTIMEKLNESNLATGTTIQRWEAYATAESTAVTEPKVKTLVLPFVTGLPPKIPTAETGVDVLWTNIKLFWDEAPQPQPDFFDGMENRLVDAPIQDKFSEDIVPAKADDVPCIPNLFIEVKGPKGSTHVVQNQAYYDGAQGARAMLRLRQYLPGAEAFDGCAYSFMATYEAGGSGNLTLWACHPSLNGSREEYIMSRLKGYMLMNSLEDFIAGANALQNLREMARQERMNLVARVKSVMDVEVVV